MGETKGKRDTAGTEVEEQTTTKEALVQRMCDEGKGTRNWTSAASSGVGDWSQRVKQRVRRRSNSPPKYTIRTWHGSTCFQNGTLQCEELIRPILMRQVVSHWQDRMRAKEVDAPVIALSRMNLPASGESRSTYRSRALRNRSQLHGSPSLYFWLSSYALSAIPITPASISHPLPRTCAASWAAARD